MIKVFSKSFRGCKHPQDLDDYCYKRDKCFDTLIYLIRKHIYPYVFYYYFRISI